MAIGRASTHGSEKADKCPDFAPPTGTHDDVAIRNFIIGCGEVQAELEKYYKTRTRDIDHCFQKLNDNVPVEIVNAPINTCLDSYAEFYAESEKRDKYGDDLYTNEAEIIDESVSDEKISQNTAAQVPVMPEKPTKGKVKKTESNVEIAAKQTQPAKKQDENDQFRLQVMFFFKDLTRITSGLSDLNKYDVSQLHDSCVDDFKTILNAIKK